MARLQSVSYTNLLIERPQYDAPKFWLNPDIKDFYQFTTDDIKITDYVTGEQIKDIPIAV